MILIEHNQFVYLSYRSGSTCLDGKVSDWAQEESTMNDAQQFADRYAAVWNETDPTARRKAIAELWVPNGIHYVKTREARGYDALEKRIIGSHEKNVRDGGNRFRAVKNAQALRNVVTFNWEMIPAGGGEVAAVGLEFLVMDDAGRIVSDYQFIVE
jgi:hypothetical protein